MYSKLTFLILLLFSTISLGSLDVVPCNLRVTKYGQVCVCNSTYCDTVPPVKNLSSGQYQIYTTSKNSLGFASSTAAFTSLLNGTASLDITVDNLSDTYQKIIGFGGAFTDSTGINIAALPATAQQFLLESYFGENGVEYSLARVPIGGTDFSTRAYTYCDEEDLALDKFALAQEDYSYKLPFIKKALELRKKKQLLFFASAWSSPGWTKSSNKVKGSGELKTDYYDWWAKYYIKFFEAYKTNGVNFWGQSAFFLFQADHLGPTIRNSTFSDLKIIAYDDSRDLLPILKSLVLSDNDTIKYIDGVGIHWYSDFVTPKFFLNSAMTNKSEWFVLGTEACNGFIKLPVLIKAVELGSWARGVNYINNIFDDLEHNVSGWTDWNMALSTSGGPTFIYNYVDSPIIVNTTSGEFYKQPMFYALGHFSKFLLPGSVRIATKVSSSKIRVMIFKRPDNKIAMIISNDSDDILKVGISIQGTSNTTVSIISRSINSLLINV
ncbi:hypothetical protein GWI33_003164 [Rhynchophorus ferrugineus]|uniref:Glucosylceramidase n=1 Tax=Rhynchophorus ferrugineus TaxID=354439 RepID=A0A834IWV7_RHYFE|nr:hypothetical protein GWI33_003164 [Rhynchophorus ferrugineus]